jgi:hypothetical protein
MSLDGYFMFSRKLNKSFASLISETIQIQSHSTRKNIHIIQRHMGQEFSVLKIHINKFYVGRKNNTDTNNNNNV